ncbi:hypothetical protein V5799_029262, partial [Amblyomma americanum]
MRSQLKLQLSWLISEDEQSHDWRLAAYRAFFAKQAPLLGTDASFVLSEVFRKPVKSLYEEVIYQVDCSIQWPATMWFNLSYKYQQVLVNVKTRFVELFLHLKIPAMLMGEVVNEYHAKPGSAAAAAPLRWERYLTLGCSCIGGCIHGSSLCGGLILKLVIRDQSLAWRVVGRLSQRCTAGTLFCYAAVRTYCLNVTAICRTLKIQWWWGFQYNARLHLVVQERCESIQKTLPFSCAYAFKAILHITFDVLDQMVLMSEMAFDKLMRELEQQSKKEPSMVERALSHIVSSIDAGNVVLFKQAFEACCALFRDEKPPKLARGTCLVRSVFITPGRIILRPAQ